MYSNSIFAITNKKLGWDCLRHYEILMNGCVPLYLDIKDENGSFIGELRSACYSPHFKKVIGIAMINEPYCKASMAGKLEIEGNSFTVKVCDLPFI